MAAGAPDTKVAGMTGVVVLASGLAGKDLDVVSATSLVMDASGLVVSE